MLRKKCPLVKKTTGVKVKAIVEAYGEVGIK